MNKVANYLSSHSRIYMTVFCSLLTLVVGLLDYHTGLDYSFTLFYLLPIVVATWWLGSTAGITFSILSAIDWLVVNSFLNHQINFKPAVAFWNSITELSFFLIATFSITRVKAELHHQTRLAMTDALTGIANKRAFVEHLRVELARAQRYQHPLTLAYFDLDNFKMVNDRHGHSEGDRLLKVVAEATKDHIRIIDLVGRLGGDEFALLLPEIDGNAARIAIEKVQRELLAAMSEHKWPVTFSIGAITLIDVDITIDEMIDRADKLMYSVKQSGKGKLKHQILDIDRLNAA